jgi:gliding motility-associated-like protein
MKSICFIFLAVGISMSAAAQMSVSPSSIKSVTVTPESSTGLNSIIVVESAVGATLSYKAQSSSSSVKRYKFSNLGGAYAEEMTTSRNGNTWSVSASKDDMGYIVEDGTRRYYYWVTNYANHEMDLRGLKADDEQDCDRVVLRLEGSADKITYYTINGQGRELSRDLTLTYNDLEFDSDSQVYNSVEKSTTISSVSSTISVQAPYCDTDFTLSGDRFLKAWNREESVTSPKVSTTAVSAETSAVQEERDADNERAYETSGLGGSAPCVITFTAIPTDAVVYREWQLSSDSEFETVTDRYNSDEFTYTFRENGTTYVKYVAGNATGTCYYESEVYEVSIGESALECPNAFSPANQDGVNDEWKVSYRSIVTFECNIFNRWGNKMATLTSPDQGWDGKYKGKFVPSGTYFYVIKAVGADKKKYNLSGDINIINSTIKTGSSSSSRETTGE